MHAAGYDAVTVAEANKNKSFPWGLLVLLIVGIVTVNLVAALPRLDVATRSLLDTDDYMRLVRVRELADGTNDFFDGWAHRSNAPYGHAMHWTRAMDLLLLALAAPLLLFMEFGDALYFAALTAGPLLHVAIGLVIAWSAAALMKREAALFAGLAIAVQPAVLSYASIGRADHHALILLTSLVSFGALLRLAKGEEEMRHAVVGGVMSALGLWVSTESLLPILLALVSLGSFWVFAQDHRWARAARSWMWSFFCVTVLSLLIERGPADLLAAAYDRIAAPHLLLTFALAVGWTILHQADVRIFAALKSPERRWKRLGSGALVAAAIALSLGVLYPSFFRGPFAEMPLPLNELWLTRLDEFESLSQRPLKEALNLSLQSFMACAAVAWLLWKRRDRGWLIVAGFLLVYTALAISTLRFWTFAQSIAVIAVTAIAWEAIEWSEQRFGAKRAIVFRLPFILGALILFALPSALLPSANPPPRESNERSFGPCDMEAASAALPGPHIVLAPIDAGPELLYRSEVSVLATPYRNVGILDAHDLWTAPFEEAVGRFSERGIDALVLCDPMLDLEVGQTEAGSLLDALRGGRGPSGWRRLAVSDGPTIWVAQRAR